MMKQILILMGILFVLLTGCEKIPVGYLLTEDASYEPDSLIIRKTLDPVLDAEREANEAPWLTLNMQGYKGTQQILFSIESVTSDAGTQASLTFMEELTIRGGGVMSYPLYNHAIPGRYKVSVRLTGPGHSHVLKDIYTFIVVE